MQVVIADSLHAPASPIDALSHLLDDLANVVAALSTEAYCAPFEGGVSGTIGEHVRHCLDHVAALLSAGPTMVLSYDRRQRGTAVEMSPAAALQQVMQLRMALERWARRSLEEPVLVSSVISRDGQTVTGWSTLARELAFVVSHTIHHHATIGVLLMLRGIAVPARFGHSPSTPRR